MGYLSVRDSMKGTLGEGSFKGEPEDEVFDGYAKLSCRQTSLFIGALLGNLEGVHLPGLLRKKTKDLSLVGNWDLRKGTDRALLR